MRFGSAELREKIEQFRQRKGLYRLTCLMVLTIGICAAILTLAYFTSTDKVTNRIESEELTLELIEENWDAVGSEEAKTAESGQAIAKDPAVKNTSDSELYVRLKIEIAINGESLKEDSNEYKAVISQLRYVNDTSGDIYTFATFDLNNEIYCENSNYLYYDGYFYLKKALAAKETTDPLFDYLLLPTKKTDYDDIFGNSYSINIVAQGIPTTLLSQTSDEISGNNIAAAAKAFDSYHE